MVVHFSNTKEIRHCIQGRGQEAKCGRIWLGAEILAMIKRGKEKQRVNSDIPELMAVTLGQGPIQKGTLEENDELGIGNAQCRVNLANYRVLEGG